MGRPRTWIIVVSMLVALVAIALAVLPVGVRLLAERRGEALTGRQVTIGDVDLNLFTGRLVATGVRVHGRDGEPAPLMLERLSTRFRIPPLLRGRWHLEQLTLAGLDVYLQRTAPDRFNVSDVVAHIAARPEGEPVAAVVEALLVTGSRVRLDDRAVEPARRWTLGEIALEAYDIVTVGDAAEGRASATFVLAGAPGTLEVRRLGLRPLRARATATADGLDVAGLAAYVPVDASVRPAGGRVTTEVTVDYDADGTVRASGAASARDLVVARPGVDPPLLTVPALSLTAREVLYEAGDITGGRVALAADRVTVLDATAPRARPLDATALQARWEKPPRDTEAGPGRLSVSADLPRNGRLAADGTVDVLPLTADVGVRLDAIDVALAQPWIPPGAAIQPVGGRLAGTLDLHYAPDDGLVAGGRLRVDHLAIARAGQEPAFLRDQRVVTTVRDLVLRDGALTLGRVEVTGAPTLTDASVTPAHRVHVPRLRVVAEGGAVPGDAPSRLRLDAALPDGGRLQASGTGSLAPASLSLEVRAADADLALAAPYVSARSPIALRQGRLDGRASVAWDGALRARGHLVARDLTLLRRGQSEPFIHHPSLEATVSGLVVRDGRLVIERVVAEGAPTIVDATSSPPQRFDVRALSLTVEDFTWPGHRRARVNGRASIADGGRGELTGTVDPATLATDVRARFENVDVTRVRAYMGPDVPLDVERGRGEATVTLRHRRDDGSRLDAEGTVHDLALRLNAAGGIRIEDERIDFRLADLLVRDGTTSFDVAVVDGTPALGRTEMAPPLSRLHAALRGLRWPGGPAAPWRVVAEPPDGGRLTVTGTLAPATWTVAGTIEAEDAAIAPFSALLPVDAEVTGRLDAHVHGKVGPELPVTLEGDLTLRQVSIDPADTAALRAARLDLDGAVLRGRSLSAARLLLHEPSVPVEREDDGTFPLRAMLAPAPFPAASPGERSGRPESARETEDSDFRFAVEQIMISEGHVRFIDRTTTPAYSEEITRLTATVSRLGSSAEGPATVTLQGVVGANAALDLRGEVAPFATPFFLDLRGELRDFAVPRTNPYLRRFLDWIARRGDLSTEVHYRIVGDELTATNEVLVERLDVEQVAAGDRSNRLVGVPLGLAVALLKDARGDIRVSVPVSGLLSSPEFSFGDAIRGALGNVLRRLVTSPLRAIGSAFRRDGAKTEVAVEPVRFEPASAVIEPDAAAHLLRVADVLRASPYVRLTLEPVVSEADLRALRVREVAARIQGRQREEDLENFAAAARRVWRASRPGTTPPENPEAVVRALAEDEPVPAEAARRLAERRLDATRTFLADTAGIQADRLLDAGGAPRVGASGDGRVAFGLRPANG